MKNRIRTIRKNAGMTQQQFAERLGISRNTVATYETSPRVPIDAVLVSICREFGVREEWLRTGQGDIYMELTPDLELSKWFEQILMEEESSFKRRFLLALTTLKEGEWKALEHLSDGMLRKADQA